MRDDDIFRIFREMQKKEKERKKKYGDVKSIIQAEASGMRFVAIGDAILNSNKWNTFIDFLMSYLFYVFGEEWLKAEKVKKRSEQHPVMQWKYSISQFQNQQEKNKDELYCSIPSGPFQAFITLAYDLYLLKHHMRLQDSIVQRLKIVDQFQGARYELFSASTMIRAGFDIHHEEKFEKGKKIVEFIAVHKESGEKVAIEAKSRHRPGVLGHAGTKETSNTIRVRVGQLINSAITKKPNLPFFIFIDLNLPPKKMTVFDDPKLRELIKTLNTAPKSPEGRDYFNMILYTNFPYHYGDELKVYPDNHLSVAISQKPLYPLRDNRFIQEIQIAVKKYGRIPNEFAE